MNESALQATAAELIAQARAVLSAQTASERESPSRMPTMAMRKLSPSFPGRFWSSRRF
jgi:hypothetical protein